MDQSACAKAIAGYPLFEFDSKESISQKQQDAAFAFSPLIHQKTIAVIALLYARYETVDQKQLERDWTFLKETFEEIKPEEVKEIKSLIKQAVIEDKHKPALITQGNNYLSPSVYLSTGNPAYIENVFSANTVVTPVYTATSDTLYYAATSNTTVLMTELLPSATTCFLIPAYRVPKKGLAYLEETLKKEFNNYLFHNQFAGPLKEDRKIFKRQYKLLSSVSGDKDIHCFLNGQIIELTSQRTGVTYKFRLDERKLNSLSSFNKTYYRSTPYILDIFDRDQVYLASLCVVIKDTPVLDQLTAMILYIRSGEDALILKTANMHTIGDIERLNALRQSLQLKELTDRSGGKLSQALATPSPPGYVPAPALSLSYKDKYRDLINQPKFLNLFK